MTSATDPLRAMLDAAPEAVKAARAALHAAYEDAEVKRKAHVLANQAAWAAYSETMVAQAHVDAMRMAHDAAVAAAGVFDPTDPQLGEPS